MTTKAAIRSGNNVILLVGSKTRAVNATPEILRLVGIGDVDAAMRLADTPTGLRMASDGDFTIADGQVFYNGKTQHPVLARRVLEFYDAGLEFEFLKNFIRNCELNEDPYSVEQLYSFLENQHMPITPDGCFIGYKGVKANGYSVKSGHLTLLSGEAVNGYINNAVGQVVRCPRSEVDSDPSNSCSQGLHVGSREYATGWGERVVMVKVNPKDCVSVPHNEAAKLRTCGYEVVGVVGAPLDTPLIEIGAGAAPVVSNPNWFRRATAAVRSWLSGEQTAPVAAVASQIPLAEEIVADADGVEETYCGDCSYSEADCECDEERCDDCGNTLDNCECCSECGNSDCTCEDDEECGDCHELGQNCTCI
jgi:hypothetical protein